MTKRIAFTPSKAEAHLIEAYRKAYRLDKPQDVLCAALAQLQKAEKVRAYDRLARQMQADSSPEQDEGNAEGQNEVETSDGREPETESWPPRSPLSSSSNGGTE
jgi:hypothetical protein